jgi:hypothetical protein
MARAHGRQRAHGARHQPERSRLLLIPRHAALLSGEEAYVTGAWLYATSILDNRR